MEMIGNVENRSYGWVPSFGRHCRFRDFFISCFSRIYSFDEYPGGPKVWFNDFGQGSDEKRMDEFSTREIKEFIDVATKHCRGESSCFDVVGGNEVDGFEVGPTDQDDREGSLRVLLEISDFIAVKLQAILESSPDLVKAVAAGRFNWPVRFSSSSVAGARDQCSRFRKFAEEVELGKALHGAEKGLYAKELGSYLTKILYAIHETREIPDREPGEIRVRKMELSDVPEGEEMDVRNSYVFYEDPWEVRCKALPPYGRGAVEVWADAVVDGLAIGLSDELLLEMKDPKLNSSVLEASYLYGEKSWLMRFDKKGQTKHALGAIDYSFYWLNSPSVGQQKEKFIADLKQEIRDKFEEYGAGVEDDFKAELRYPYFKDWIDNEFSTPRLREKEFWFLKNRFIDLMEKRLS